MSVTNNVLKFSAIAGMALMLSACGGNVGSILNDAKLEANNGTVALTTEIGTANLVLSAVNLPIYDRSNPPQELGRVEIMTDVTTNKSYLKVTFNYQAALNLPSPVLGSMLPNGSAVPLTGIDLSKMMTFDIGLGGSKLYLYWDGTAKKAVIGVAVNIGSLTIGQTANLFAKFNFNNVSGLAGIYLGQAAGTSGIGIFTDLSAIAFPSPVIMSEMSKPEAGVGFVPMSLTPEQQQRLDYKLYQLNSSGQPIVIK